MLPRDMIKRCARNYPTKTAYLGGERSATWARMDQRSDRFAVALDTSRPQTAAQETPEQQQRQSAPRMA